MSVFSKKIDYNLVENSSFFNNNPSHLKSINSYEDLLAWEMKILNKACSSECAIKKVVLESFLNQMDELLSKNQKVIVKFYSSGSGFDLTLTAINKSAQVAKTHIIEIADKERFKIDSFAEVIHMIGQAKSLNWKIDFQSLGFSDSKFSYKDECDYVELAFGSYAAYFETCM